MSDPNATLPPLGARTPRNLIRWLRAWSAAHQIAASIIGALIVGFVLGKVF